MSQEKQNRLEVGEQPAGDRDGKRESLTNPQYSIPTRSRQSIKPLSALLDQALYLAEFHSNLAEFHRRHAEEHRRVLRSLQGLIPRYQLNTEGELTYE